MRRKRGQKNEPPDARWRQQKCCDQDGIWRPKDRDRMRVKRERKSDSRAQIITDKDPYSGQNWAKIERPIPNKRNLRRRFNSSCFKWSRDTSHGSMAETRVLPLSLIRRAQPKLKIDSGASLANSRLAATPNRALSAHATRLQRTRASALSSCTKEFLIVICTFNTGRDLLRSNFL